MLALIPLSPNSSSRERDTTSKGGRLARIRKAATELTPEAIDQIARRVAELLRERPINPEATVAASCGLLNAAELAQRLGVTRAWVYEHARELGAIQLGEGARPRLRFDADVAAQALSRHHEPHVPASSPAAAPQRARRQRAEEVVPLLPLRGNATRGIRSPLGASRRRGCV